MKKSLFFAMCAAAAFIATSCSGDGPLSASSAKSALKDTEMFAKNTYVTAFKTGYYEVSESAIDDLNKLTDAGMITYTADRVIEYRSYRRGNSWYGYYTETVEEPHTFVQVALTEAGQKHEIEKPDWAPDYLEKYVKAMKDYEEVLPEFMGAYDDAAVAEEVVVVEEAYYDEPEETDADGDSAAKPENKNKNWEDAKAKVSTDTHYMLMGQIKLEKVLLVSCTEEMFKNGEGSCSFIYTVKDKTPFGFVYGHLREGAYEFGNASFKYYNDLGWVVSKIDK